MPYITSADMVAAIGRSLTLQLFDPDNSGAIDEVIFAEARKAAESKINRYAAHRYAVPFTDAQLAELDDDGNRKLELVRQLAIDETIFARKTRGVQMATLEEIEAAKMREEVTLKGIADGTITLGVDPPPAKSSLVVAKAGPTISAKRTARESRRGTW